jgi:hypothetical protein
MVDTAIASGGRRLPVISTPFSIWRSSSSRRVAAHLNVPTLWVFQCLNALSPPAVPRCSTDHPVFGGAPFRLHGGHAGS